MERGLRTLTAVGMILAGNSQGVTLLRADLRPDSVVTKQDGKSPVGISDAYGIATFELDLTPGAPKLTYVITLFNLDLQTEVTGIHLHSGHLPVAGSTPANSTSRAPKHNGADGPNGPHLLNIFGSPRQDDGDLVVDYSSNSLSGIWDNADLNLGGDGTRDPIDSVGIAAGIDFLITEEVYIQIHSTAFPAPNTGELRGQLLFVPEPSTLSIIALSILGISGVRRRT